LLLTIFYGALCLALVLLVVAATSLYLERKRLFTLADGASLVGAEAFTLDDVTPTVHGNRPLLTSPEVASAVSAYLAGNPTDHFTDLHVERAVSVDGRSATVELSCYWEPPVLTLFIPKGFRIEVTSIARSVFS
ncbi:MAG TPA: pilus assembly protein TadG-related protein, partial [Galbitalea sp.]|nr:pilus assembly protein TadG-related protein [Galbitalea sp.]